MRAQGLDVRFTCFDINRYLRSRALTAAAELGFGDRFEFRLADCDRIDYAGTHDLLIANQFLHHVRNIEGFCAMLRRSLAPQGAVLACDVIGRNGHLLWPSVHAEVRRHWQSLEPGQRFDRHFGKRKDVYVPVDHAAYSNEGVRAQDVVAGLSRELAFETFVSYGAAVMPFVERRLGFNFDPGNPDDRDFIDRIAANDADAIASARYPASNMIAVLRHKSEPRAERHVPVGPRTHIELTRAELAVAGTRIAD